jgi:hypothetical protein
LRHANSRGWAEVHHGLLFDLSTATIPPLGKPERLIGRFAKKELEMETL